MNAAYAADLRDPEALLDRYEILTGWSEALLAAGAGEVAVLQRFHHDTHVHRRGVHYIFRADSHGPAPPRYRWMRGLYAAAAAWRPDVVHVNGLNMAAQCWALRRSLSPDAAIVLQDHEAAEPRWDGSGIRQRLRRAVTRRGLRVVDGFLFSAHALAAPWLEAGLIQSTQPIAEVPAASTNFRALPREEARRDTAITGRPAVLWVGRLAPVKDPMTVLHGVALAAERLPELTLTMVHNGGELESDVRHAIACDAALTQRVRLVSAVPRHQLPAYFAAADLFVSGSRHEACGLALVEALACGTGVVVPAIPAFEALTGHGACGVLWTAGDAHALGASIVTACARPLQELRVRSQARFASALSWRHVGERAMRLYARSLANRGAHAVAQNRAVR